MYLRHFLQFGTQQTVAPARAGDLTLDGTMVPLAWAVVHFVPLVLHRPLELRQNMLSEESPIVDCITCSDLAFVVLVLEHHIMKWRHLIHWERETGEPPSDERSRTAIGLLYDGGMAGEAAKRRFDDLSLYFFMTFWSDATANKKRNVDRLERLTREIAKEESSEIAEIISAPQQATILPPQEEQSELVDDVLHRVFYYINS